jgi:rubrerythrin
MTHHFDRALAMLSTALEMEEKGKAFYEKAVNTCKNQLGVKIFTMLKKDEDIHVQRIQKIYEQLNTQHTWSAEWKNFGEGHADLGQVFRDLAAAQGHNIQAGTGDLEALDVGITFEFNSVRFYEDQLKAATEETEKEFVKRMIAEESGHHTALSEMKAFLADPAAWFREQERTGFDGGTAMA